MFCTWLRIELKNYNFFLLFSFTWLITLELHKKDYICFTESVGGVNVFVQKGKNNFLLGWQQLRHMLKTD